MSTSNPYDSKIVAALLNASDNAQSGMFSGALLHTESALQLLYERAGYIAGTEGGAS